jgi:2-polyprenyl-3-methyl-5-hydroxy-6-metoxy-1,4-benzoquinol methylase
MGESRYSVANADGHDRYIPGHHTDSLMRAGHESRYRWVAENFPLEDLRVLDFGCGSGYGAAYLADHAAEVIGIDISASAIRYARSNYQRPNLRFLEADLCGRLPDDVSAGTFDLAISSEVIEHVPDVFGFLRNLTSLLTAAGIAIIGTPNRRFSYRHQGAQLLSASHVMELTPEHLQDLMLLWFQDVEMFVHRFPAPPASSDAFPARMKRGIVAGLREVIGNDGLERLRTRVSRAIGGGGTAAETEMVTAYVPASVPSPEWETPEAMGMVCVGWRLGSHR